MSSDQVRRFGGTEPAEADGVQLGVTPELGELAAVAGLLVASALVRPEKATGMKVSSVKKKLKEKAFAPGVHRDEVLDVEDKIGVPLDEFLAVSIEGLQEVAPQIDL